MKQTRPVYSAAEVTARARARKKRQRQQAAGIVLALLLIGGNVALVIWRVEVVGWLRERFGGVELVVEKK